MQFWIIQTLNSIAFGGLLFLLSSGFSLAFGLMRIPNLAHGGFFMLGAYLGATITWFGGISGSRCSAPALASACSAFCSSAHPAAACRQCAGQVLVTLGVSFIIADVCLLIWTGDPWTVAAPAELRPPLRVAGLAFPTYRLVVLGIALVVAVALYLLMDRTRLGAMIRAGVDDMEMARGVGIPVSLLFTVVFCLGAVLAGIGGALGAPMLNAYPGLDADMLPLALIVVILGGAGSLLGAFVGSFVVGFLYNFGIALFPDLAYFILFLPMVLVLVFMPQGLFGRVQRVRRTGFCSASRRGADRGAARHQERFYINLASQILIYALLAVSLNLLLGYGGMVSLGHASFLGLAAYAATLFLNAGAGQSRRRCRHRVLHACGALFGVLALRASGIGFLMITLALGQIVWGIAYRANTLTDGDNGLRYAGAPAAVRHRHQQRAELLLVHADRVRDRAVLHLARHALAVRRVAAGRARPAAPHAHARP